MLRLYTLFMNPYKIETIENRSNRTYTIESIKHIHALFIHAIEYVDSGNIISVRSIINESYILWASLYYKQNILIPVHSIISSWLSSISVYAAIDIPAN